MIRRIHSTEVPAGFQPIDLTPSGRVNPLDPADKYLANVNKWKKRQVVEFTTNHHRFTVSDLLETAGGDISAVQYVAQANHDDRLIGINEAAEINPEDVPISLFEIAKLQISRGE